MQQVNSGEVLGHSGARQAIMLLHSSTDYST